MSIGFNFPSILARDLTKDETLRVIALGYTLTRISGYGTTPSTPKVVAEAEAFYNFLLNR